jgi:hypothetical protein
MIPGLGPIAHISVQYSKRTPLPLCRAQVIDNSVLDCHHSRALRHSVLHNFNHKREALSSYCTNHPAQVVCRGPKENGGHKTKGSGERLPAPRLIEIGNRSVAAKLHRLTGSSSNPADQSLSRTASSVHVIRLPVSGRLRFKIDR